jgi:hypothetical protein
VRGGECRSVNGNRESISFCFIVHDKPHTYYYCYPFHVRVSDGRLTGTHTHIHHPYIQTHFSVLVAGVPPPPVLVVDAVYRDQYNYDDDD